jgi:hypothetical protein
MRSFVLTLPQWFVVTVKAWGGLRSGDVMQDQAICPSAQPEQPNAVIIGVVRRSNGAVATGILPETVPLHPLIDLVPENVRPTEVLRFAAPCAGAKCRHFSDDTCTLAARIIARLPAVTDRLGRCAIRPSCRWWQQEGPLACQRCPQVVTEPYKASDLMREVARSSIGGDSDHVAG